MFVKDLEPAEVSALLADPDAFELIDVRTPGEMAGGILPHARGMPMSVLPLRLDEIPKDKQVVFYCRTGARSAQVCMYLGQRGYDNVYNLRGGIVTWAQCGLEIAPGDTLRP